MLQSRGYDISEHPLFGGVTYGAHVAGSQHYNRRGPGGGGAIDVNADPWNSPFKNERAAINQIIGLAGGYGLRTIWQSAGHYDHAHFDISKLGNMVGAGVAKYLTERNGSGMGAFGAGGMNIEDLFARMDQNRGGFYGKLEHQFEKTARHSPLAKLLDRYGAMMGGGNLPGGDTGAHTGQARINQAIARSLLPRYGFPVSEMTALIRLWNGESGWNQYADNPSSDAYGIPQSLPGSKMASAGSDWRTNPAHPDQVGAGLHPRPLRQPVRGVAAVERPLPALVRHRRADAARALDGDERDRGERERPDGQAVGLHRQPRRARAWSA